jgi:hypothetical protein
MIDRKLRNGIIIAAVIEAIVLIPIVIYAILF